MKGKLKRICFILLILGGIIVLPLAGWRLYLAHTIDRKLEKIRAAGLPTNGEDLNRWYPAVPDAQNSALVLTQAFALLHTINSSSDERAKKCSELRAKFPRRVELLTTEQVKMLRWFVETNQPAMLKAQQALRLSSARYPIDCSRLMDTELPHLAHLLSLAYLNQCHAALSVLDGQSDAAPEQIATALALARTLDNEPCAVSQLVREKLISISVTILELRANTSPLSNAEIQFISDAFNRTCITNISAFALIGDRAMLIPYFRMTRAEHARLRPANFDHDSKSYSLLPCYGPAILRLIGYYELDYGSFLIGMEKAIAHSSNAPPQNLRAAGYFARIGEESTKRERVLSGTLFSSYANIWARENNGIAQHRIALTALAVERYRNDNGKFPETLDEMVSEHFPEVPEDPFNGAELQYRRTDKGYVIYSVGPDCEDNGGLELADKKQSEDGKSYDITFTVER